MTAPALQPGSAAESRMGTGIAGVNEARVKSRVKFWRPGRGEALHFGLSAICAGPFPRAKGDLRCL